MKNYYSITHSTSNENGHEQLELEHKKSFLRWLFRKPAKKEVFVKYILLWYYKETQLPVDLKKRLEIDEVLYYFSDKKRYTWD